MATLGTPFGGFYGLGTDWHVEPGTLKTSYDAFGVLRPGSHLGGPGQTRPNCQTVSSNGFAFGFGHCPGYLMRANGRSLGGKKEGKKMKR